ncbi:MAG: mechanosensitive ion channel family protein [Treponema sp.]|nr:mechanosensitive ion channel family protein [Treponema sp.]MCL2251760.1 mechanosensitive ion channel family protein [Treponema sp.]
MKQIIFLLLTVFMLTPILLTAQEAPVTSSEEITEETSESITAENAEQVADENLLETEKEEIYVERLSFYQRLAIAAAIVLGLVLLIRLIWFLFKRLEIKLEHSSKNKIKSLIINKFTILSAKQVVKIIEQILRIIKYLLTAVLFFIALPIIFSLFSATREFALTLLSYIINPLKDIALNTLHYIPNLFKIAIIVIITRYVLKALNFFADKIEKGKLVLRGFYTEWAAPTYKILQVLLWAFTVALIYPLLPDSNSSAFRGVSVFIGIVFSIGSTSAIGNLVAGLVITYMRPFKIGDRVQIKEITGFVVEKNLMVVRLKTNKNEYVTFPNLIILSSNIINYNTSTDEDEEGLIIFAEVTVGYSTPWQEIHDILINAALKTEHIQKKPKPFVLQTKLEDFYACYQINCYTKDVSIIPRINSLLYENIQNGFREAGLDMTSAHYRVIAANNED